MQNHLARPEPVAEEIDDAEQMSSADGVTEPAKCGCRIEMKGASDEDGLSLRHRDFSGTFVKRLCSADHSCLRDACCDFNI